jgi:bacterioferritin (cytochrome b1)
VSAALTSDWKSRLVFEVEKAIETGSVWDADQFIHIELLLFGEPDLHKSTLPNGSVDL